MKLLLKIEDVDSFGDKITSRIGVCDLGEVDAQQISVMVQDLKNELARRELPSGVSVPQRVSMPSKSAGIGIMDINSFSAHLIEAGLLGWFPSHYFRVEKVMKLNARGVPTKNWDKCYLLFEPNLVLSRLQQYFKHNGSSVQIRYSDICAQVKKCPWWVAQSPGQVKVRLKEFGVRHVWKIDVDLHPRAHCFEPNDRKGLLYTLVSKIEKQSTE